MLRGCPFIIKSFKIYQSPFLNRQKSCVVNSFLHPHASGYSKKNDVSELVRAAFGEFLERFAVFKCLKKDVDKSGDPYFMGFSLIDGKEIKVPAEHIVLNESSPIFKYCSKTPFTDTCGMAAHINSELAIEKAYLEFIERQSLIHSWLTIQPGIIIQPTFSDSYLSKKYNVLNSQLSHVYFINISIRKDIKVIMTIGYNETLFSIGLGAHWDLEKAIESSIDEFVMVFEGLAAHKIYERGKKSHTGNLYVDYFYNLDIEEFKKEIEYLLQYSEEVDFRDIEWEKDWSFKKSISEFHKELNIDLYVVHIPFPVHNNDAKIVKIYSPDAYPHMNTELFDPRDYKISQKLHATSFPNIYRMIPFA